VLFRVVGGLEEVRDQVEEQLYSFFGVPDIPVDYVPPPEPPGEAEATVEMEPAPEGGEEVDGDPASGQAPADVTSPSVGAEGPVGSSAATVDQPAGRAASEAEAKEEARASIRRALRDVTTKVAALDFRSIGFVGLILFIYAAIALADSVEDLFNRIFDAPSVRPIHIRFAIHWSVITLGSGLLALSLYMSSQVIDWFGEIGAHSSLRLILRHILSIAASWVLLFLIYALMPNTHVSLRSAVIGAVVAAVLWEAAKFGFQIYVATAVPYSALYGSLGLIPLFLFWIYVTWWIVLFGIILTYALQTLRGRHPAREEEELLPGDPDWMLPIMTEVAREFRRGESVEIQELADRLGLTGGVVREMAAHLIGANLLRRVEATMESSAGLALARPAETITVQEILQLAMQSRPNQDHPAWNLLRTLKAAELKSAGDRTLADTLEAQPVAPATA
jgi:membrane protein